MKKNLSNFDALPTHPIKNIRIQNSLPTPLRLFIYLFCKIISDASHLLNFHFTSSCFLSQLFRHVFLFSAIYQKRKSKIKMNFQTRFELAILLTMEATFCIPVALLFQLQEQLQKMKFNHINILLRSLCAKFFFCCFLRTLAVLLVIILNFFYETHTHTIVYLCFSCKQFLAINRCLTFANQPFCILKDTAWH